MKIETGALLEALNRMLTPEHAGDVRSAFARKIRRRIRALGGVPTTPPLRTVVQGMDQG